jgi:putative ABC transport system permease protein
MILTVAWRNIWRNKRRTLITIASIFFALYFALMIRSIQIGTFGKMTDDMISSYTGHLQIHKAGYWDEPIINNVFQRDKNFESEILKHEAVKHIVPRIESFALASLEERTKGCMITGIDPEVENSMAQISKFVVDGNYLEQNDDGAIIGDKLAEYLGLKLGDTLVLIGQGYHSMSAAGLYPVKGILHFPSPELNSRVVYMSLTNAQEFYSTDNQLTSLSILLDRNDNIETVKSYIKNLSTNEEYEVMDWGELLFELEQLIQSKQGSSIMMVGLLYMIVGFGIFGTIVMMTAERWREFGLLAAVGMKKLKLMITVFTETVILGFLGLLSGFAVALPIMLYFSKNPIVLEGQMAETYEEFGFEGVLVFSSSPEFMINQIIVISVLVLIAVSYPILKLRKLKPVDAMKA